MGTSFTVDLPNSPADGNALILTVHISKDSVTPVTVSSVSSTGASWALVQGQTKDDGVSLAVDTEIWAALNVSSALTTITITLTDTALAAFAFAREDSDIATSSATDVTASNSGTVATLVDSGTTAAIAGPDELAIASLTSASAFTFDGSPSNGFSVVDQEIGFSLSGEFLEKYPTAIETENTSDSTGVFSGIWAGAIAVFLPAAAPTPPDLQPAEYSSIGPVLVFKRKDKVQKVRTRLSVRAPPFPIMPPAQFQRAMPKQYSSIYTVLDYLALRERWTYPRKLTVQPPTVWTYNFDVNDSMTITDSVISGPTVSDSITITDSLDSLTSALTVNDSAQITDSLAALAVTVTVNDYAYIHDSLQTPTVPVGEVNLSILMQPVTVTVLPSPIVISITQQPVKVTVEPD